MGVKSLNVRSSRCKKKVEEDLAFLEVSMASKDVSVTVTVTDKRYTDVDQMAIISNQANNARVKNT